MSSVAIIGDIDTVSGFRLGGVKKAEVVNTADEAIVAFDKFWTLVAGEFKHLPSPRASHRYAYSFGLCHFWDCDQLFIQIPFHSFHLSNCQVDSFLSINQAAYLSSFYLASQLIVILFGSCFSFVDGS